MKTQMTQVKEAHDDLLFWRSFHAVDAVIACTMGALLAIGLYGAATTGHFAWAVLSGTSLGGAIAIFLWKIVLSIKCGRAAGRLDATTLTTRGD